MVVFGGPPGVRIPPPSIILPKSPSPTMVAPPVPSPTGHPVNPVFPSAYVPAPFVKNVAPSSGIIPGSVSAGNGAYISPGGVVYLPGFPQDTRPAPTGNYTYQAAIGEVIHGPPGGGGGGGGPPAPIGASGSMTPWAQVLVLLALL